MPRAIERRKKLDEVLPGDGDLMWLEFTTIAMDDLRAEIAAIEQRLRSPDNVFTLGETDWARLREVLAKVSRQNRETTAELKGRLRLWHDVLSGGHEVGQPSARPKSCFEVDLLDWLSDAMLRLREQARSSAETIRRAIAVAKEASIYRNLAALRDWLHTARLSRSSATFARFNIDAASPTALRKLIGEVSSPAIMAAGGDCARYVTRC